MAGLRDFSRYSVEPGAKVRLGKLDPSDTSGFKGGKKEAEEVLGTLRGKLEGLQELLYAEHRHKILVVLQGMDTSGKDGVIRKVFEGVNPEGVRVAHFGPPTEEEKDHDFLWRVHPQVPGSGEIVIFNRSHYESVLVERVHGLVPRDVWQHRYAEIVDFERLLVEEGTVVMKFFLHIDREEQRERLEERLDDPTKHWKFSVNDLPERKFWSEYMDAYADAIEKTSSKHAKWYVVPSNHKWFRDLLVCSALVGALEEMGMRYPPLPKGDKGVVVP